MDIETAKFIWSEYRKYLKNDDEENWINLWLEDSQFTENDKPQLVIAYGRGGTPPFLAEKYIGRQKIRDLIFGSKKKLEDPRLSEGEIYVTDRNNVFFCIFDLTIKTIDGYLYNNHIICKFSIDGNKIREIVEFCDPRRRNDFFVYLNNMS